MTPRPCFEIKVSQVIATGTKTVCTVRLSVVQDVPNPTPHEPPFVREFYSTRTIICDAGWDYPRLQQTLRVLAPTWQAEIGPPVATLPVLCQLIPETP